MNRKAAGGQGAGAARRFRTGAPSFRGGLTAVALLLAAGCIGRPRAPGPLPPEDDFSLGDGKLFVTYQAEDRMAIVDPFRFDAPPAIARVIDVGSDPFALDGPHEAMMGPDGESYFVTVQTGPRVWADADAGAAAPDAACNIDVDPHCAHRGGPVPGAIERYRLRDNSTVGRAKVGFAAAQIAIPPDGRRVYASAFDHRAEARCGIVAVINPATMTELAPIQTCRSPHGIAITPDGKTLVVACEQGDRVALIPTDGGPASEIAVGIDPGDRCLREPADPTPYQKPRYLPSTVAITRDGKTAFVALTTAKVVAIDLATATLTDFAVYTSPAPAQVAVSPDGKTLILPSASEAVVDVIDVATRKKLTFSLRQPGTPDVAGLFGATFHASNPRVAYVTAGCLTALRSPSGSGFVCQRQRQGAVIEVQLDKLDPADPIAPPAALRKVETGSALHVTFGAPPAMSLRP